MKTPKNNKLIVVLGMHRSGTSAVTRALQVMGVELGDKLLPSREANEKGFWEDIDVNRLNIEMLNALNLDWDYLSPILERDVEALRDFGFFAAAVDLLSAKVDRYVTYGLKDPRMAKLLPFWKGVICHCQFNVSYVLTLRHPLSVAKSLASRDRFDAEKSYLLWLSHVIPSVAGTVDDNRVLVDYDRLMESPDHELRRIADRIDLTIDPAELRSYKSAFLDLALRHTVYVPDDLLSDSACPPLVRDIYSVLLDVASDKRSINDAAMSIQIANWVDEFARTKPHLALADRFYAQKSADRIASDAIRETNARAAAQRDAQNVQLTQIAAERDATIASLSRALAEQQASYKCHVTQLEQAVFAEHQAYISVGGEAATLRSQLDAALASQRWTVDALLSWLCTIAQRTRSYAFRHAIGVYRALPISHPAKQQLKNAVFSIFGFAFVRLDVYQRWAAHRTSRTTWPRVEEATRPLPTMSGEAASQPLRVADGTWEWRDYGAVKTRISQIKAKKIAQTSPAPVNLVEIGRETLASAAARVRLPSIVDSPDVSIIIPVFNNIKLTLECLLSICAHDDPHVSYEIILADDGSTDETAEVCALIPHLRFTRHEENVGFVKTCNRALKQVRGTYVLYLNNDVQVTAGWLRNLVKTFRLYPRVGAVGPRYIYPSGHLQEAGAALRSDGSADMIGLNEDSAQARFSYARRVDYVSGACIILPAELARRFGGFSEDYSPCYCEDSDLCLRVQEAGYFVYCNPAATIVHHLSKTTASIDPDFKLRCISRNLVTLQRKWSHRLESAEGTKIIAFYLPQFHPIAENDEWWGSGFTDWTNVARAQPNFAGHYQPRLPTDLGYYDLRLSEVMVQQAQLARRYGIYGFCVYYYWFRGRRLLERPIEQMLASRMPDFPFCLCWANENWTRRWDGLDDDILISQSYSPEDDRAVILDLMRFFRDPRYIRIDGRPLIVVYRVTLFPDFSRTASLWRSICAEQGIGEIYIAMVESFELVHTNTNPDKFGCDASVEFPPQGLAEAKLPSGPVNSNFSGSVADYRDLAVRYAIREVPAYTRFRGVAPGWDNTPRRQDASFCFEDATPGAFQAWLEETIEQTRLQHYGDERLMFVNAWNEWAEGAYLEPDRRFGHTYLEAVKNATQAAALLRRDRYGLGD